MPKDHFSSSENLETATIGVNLEPIFVLDAGRYDAFVHGLDNSPAPGPKLRSLLRRVPAWRK
jgi:uncharacterized protein (DUF1778 family)